MSENNDSQHVREGSSASAEDENGDHNGYVHVGPADVPAEAVADSEEGSVFVESVKDYANQGGHIEQSNVASTSAGDSIQNAPPDIKVMEDGGSQDMFVDCPDEIETSETLSTSEEKDDVQETEVKELDDGPQVHDLMAENKHLRNTLDKAAAERDSFPKKYEEERAALKKQLTHLHDQLKRLNEQPALPYKEDGELVDHFYKQDVGDDELDVINKCTKYLETFLDERCQTQFIAKRILTSLASVHQEETLDQSVTGAISNVEKATSLLLEKYNHFCHEIGHLQWCLAEIGPNNPMQDEVGTFVAARDTIMEFRGKVIDLDQKLNQAEYENKQMVEQLDKHKAIVENANAEIRKLNTELEQEKAKLANTKEKLGMAVTKGKALVQHRDSLKQSLADKTSELERCLLELQEKSSALEAAEQSKELLIKSETVAASLQEALAEKETILQKCSEIISEASETEELQLMDVIEKVRWLTNEINELKGTRLEFRSLTDALSSFDVPETVKTNGLDFQVGWLLESFNMAKEDAAKWQEEIFRTREAAENDIDRLTASLLAETQEKDYLRAELEDLRFKYEGVVQKEYHALMEKGRIVSMLLEASGITLDYQEKDYQSLSDVATIIDNCIAKIKDNKNSAFEFSHFEMENFEKFQILLYIRDVELTLCGQICEEEMIDRTELSSLSNELVVLRNKLSVSNDAQASLYKDLERSDEKAATLRDKLSMAVKKGKGLVQERENLKKMLEERNTEIENLKFELKQQVSACNDYRDQITTLSADVEQIPKLEADLIAVGEQRNEVEKFLVESNTMLQRVFESIDGIVLPADSVFEEPTEKVKWIAGYFIDCQSAKIQAEQELREAKDEAGALASKLDEVQMTMKLLQDALSAAESKSLDVLELKKELAAANTEIDRLTTALSEEAQEKDYYRVEVEDLRSKHEVVVQKEYQALTEKDSIMNMLLEAAGITLDDQEKDYQSLSDVASVFEKCIAKIKDDMISTFDSSHIGVENLENIQILLYIRDMELTLCSQICEGEMLDREDLSNELVVLRNELRALKDGQDYLQKDLQRAEEKAALLREKLSMAVKKGKGLAQERENLRRMLDERNTEIENLKLELKQQVSACDDYKDQISKLSADVEQIPKLEADVIAIEERRNEVEKSLVESTSLLQSIFESIDGIVLPADSVFEESIEKVKWVAGYFSDCQSAKLQAEQELRVAKDEANALASTLDEVRMTTKLLQDALSVAESKISELLEEKKELEASKTHVEQELQEATMQASSQTNKFAEVCASQKALKDALQMAENNNSILINEKEEAFASRAAAEMEIQKVKEEISIYTNKLFLADENVQVLEDALSDAQKNVSLLAEDNRKAISDKTDLEKEIKKLRDEVDSHVVKFTDVNSAVKSLEDSLQHAESKISDLLKQKNDAEEEISALNFKLNSCMQELAGTHGSLENRSVELSGHLTSLRRLVKDETLASLLWKSFEKKVGCLNDMNLLLREIRDHMLATDSAVLENDPLLEDDFGVPTPQSADLNNMLNVEMATSEEIASDADNIVFQIGKTVEGLHQREKVLADTVESISTFMDKLVASFLTRLQAEKHRFTGVQELINSLKEKVTDMEMDRQALKNTVSMLERHIESLFPACSDATKELESEFQSCLSVLRSNAELGKLNEPLLMELETIGVETVVGDQLELESNTYSKAAEELLTAARRSRVFNIHLLNLVSNLNATIEYLQNERDENKRTCENLLEERDLCQNKISKLESDLKASENLCMEMTRNLDEREAELSSLYATSLKKTPDTEDSLLSASQMKSLFDKIAEIEVPLSELGAGDLQLHNSADIRKLFFIVDSYTDLRHQIRISSHDKEGLQSTLERHIHEIEELKEAVEERQKEQYSSEKLKSELLELGTGLEKIIQKLGGEELIEHPNAVDVTELLHVLENLVSATKMESENFKSKAEELDVKLLGTQKVVDDLSIKVRLLEDSSQLRAASTDTVQSRGTPGTSSPAHSEISEIQDAGPVGMNKAIPSGPPAAHPRTLRKGSSDHLAINIDSESKRLINEEADEDKGHIFKSLNTSGLVPRQGKMFADRVDGIWVSGSRALMNHPRARLVLISYWLFVHLWLLATIL